MNLCDDTGSALIKYDERLWTEALSSLQQRRSHEFNMTTILSPTQSHSSLSVQRFVLSESCEKPLLNFQSENTVVPCYFFPIQIIQALLFRWCLNWVLLKLVHESHACTDFNFYSLHKDSSWRSKWTSGKPRVSERTQKPAYVLWQWKSPNKKRNFLQSWILIIYTNPNSWHMLMYIHKYIHVYHYFCI